MATIRLQLVLGVIPSVVLGTDDRAKGDSMLPQRFVTNALK